MHDVSILDECVAITKDLKHIKSQLIVASKLSDVSQILIGASALRTRIANLQSTSNSNEHVNLAALKQVSGETVRLPPSANIACGVQMPLLRR
jgi:hypothetical protein